MFTALVDSRRLPGPNLYSRHPGAILEIAVDEAHRDEVATRWQQCVRLVMDALGWQTHEIVVRSWPSGLGLFISAPIDALLAATEVTEQALVLAEADPASPDCHPSHDLLARLRVHIRHEANSRLRGLAAEAAARQLVLTWDDDEVAVGCGAHQQRWPLRCIPVDVPWAAVRDMPIALVTGSNGKTTTTRLLAAMLCQAGHTVGFTSTDGVVVGTELVVEGDYAGPAGARRVLGDARVTAAVLETARGGMLRRGLAMTFADAAVVTRIAADHLGEYGIHSARDLADAKLIVRRALRPGVPLVLNADDPLLVEAARELEMPIRWFSLDEANPVVQQSIDAGGWAAVCRGDWVVMAAAGESWPVAPIAEIPITLGGAAVHNVANVLAAVATASTLGVTTGQIAESLRTFGLSPRDNPGRLQVRAVHGATVIVDFVHNPDGWQAILQMVARLRTQRLIVTLGQAGDRDDIALHDLAEAVWHGRPDLIVLKEMEDYLRGRPYGQTSGVLASALHDAGAPPERVRHAPTELEAAQMALRAARPGDVVVIATHSHYKDVLALVDAAASATARHPLES